MPATPPLTEIESRLKRWNGMAFKLRVASVVLGLIAVTSSILVASDLLTSDVRRILAVVAAVATATLTSLDLTAKSNSTRAAWRRLNAQMMRYRGELDPDRANALATLIDAYEQAEAQIGDIRVTTAQAT